MSNNFNIGEIARLAQTLLDSNDKGKEFMLEDVHRLTRAAYERYQEDYTIAQMASTIERLAEKALPGATISQAEISAIYNNFVRPASASRFREVLGVLLFEDAPTAKAENPAYVNLNRLDAESEKAIKDEVDTKLTDTLAGVFSVSDSDKTLDPTIATQGAGFVSAELKSLGFSPAIEVMGGNAANIVYAAHFDTRKGRITVAIPTEINNGRVLFPSTFVANDHLEELTPTTLSTFVESKVNSGDFSVPKTADILSAIKIITGQAKEIESQKFSELTKDIKDDKDIALAIPNLFAERDFSAPKADIDTHQDVAMPPELIHLSRDFEDDILEAASSFGLESIRKGKELVAMELRSFGFKNARVQFGSESNGSVIYLASINTGKGPVTIEVPIEMHTVAENKYMPLAPAYFAYDGLVEDFTATKLQRFAISAPIPSTKTTVCASSFSYMLLPELKDEIVKAASENDYVTCETILDEIKERFQEEDFKNAISDYHFVLTQKAKLNKQPQYKCNRLLKSNCSIEDRCGHYLCGISKVITDENGNCRLKTSVERERLNPIEEGGACISSSKINLT